MKRKWPEAVLRFARHDNVRRASGVVSIILLPSVAVGCIPAEVWAVIIPVAGAVVGALFAATLILIGAVAGWDAVQGARKRARGEG